MFTGIIKDKGRITNIIEGDKNRRMTIATKLDMAPVDIGASICCNGCCLTVVSKTDHSFDVDVAAETLAVTTLGGWSVDTEINIEPSLRLGDEMGGHIVSGHVDGLATVEAIEADGEAWRVTLSVPDNLAQYIASKGSVAINGTSMTINEVEDNHFGVCVIPHTWDVTTFSNLKAGDRINLEVDMLARYVARILGKDAA